MSPSGGITLSRSAGDARADLALAIFLRSTCSGSPTSRTSPAASRPQRRPLVLTGLPRAFSAGVDIADHAPEAGAIDRMLAAMRGVLDALIETPAITVASVSGACLGGGAELAAPATWSSRPKTRASGFRRFASAASRRPRRCSCPSRIGEARAARVDPDAAGPPPGGRRPQPGFASRAFPADSLERETALLVEGAPLAQPRWPSPPPATSCAAAAGKPSRAPCRAEDAYRKLDGSEDLREAVASSRRSRSARRRSRQGSPARLPTTDSDHQTPPHDRLPERRIPSARAGEDLPRGPRLPLRRRHLRGRALLRGRPYRLAEHLERHARRASPPCASRPTPRFYPDGGAPAPRGERPHGRRRDRLRAGLARRRAARARVSRRRARRRPSSRSPARPIPRRRPRRSGDPRCPTSGGAAATSRPSCSSPTCSRPRRRSEAGAIDAILTRDGIAWEGNEGEPLLRPRRRRAHRAQRPAHPARRHPRGAAIEAARPPRPLRRRAPLPRRRAASPPTKSSSPRRRCGPTR